MEMSYTEADKAMADLTCGALFYGMRSCEYLDTPAKEFKKTKLLELNDIKFFNILGHRIHHNSPSLHLAEFVTIRFKTQKNGVKNEQITNRRSGLYLCPVVIWARIVKRLLKNPLTNHKTKINTVYIGDTKRSFKVTSTMIVNLLRNTVQILGPEKLGIPIKSVGTHSIRTSFAMMLNLSDKADSFIMKQGRWRSDAFLRYIRNYVDNFGGDASALIARLDNEFISLLHK